MKKNVVLGVSGGIAVYKCCELVSRLKKIGYDVKVIMTANAKEFVAPLTFETLSKNAVITDMFAEKPHYEVEHISLAKWAGVFIVAPATANIIAKLANGIADDMLTTAYSATEAIKIVCPAMNSKMYLSEANLKNIETLRSQGVHIIEPKEGLLACGDSGIGRMEEASVIAEIIDSVLTPKPDFRGKRVLITAGGTAEDIDGVRYIGNRSSGKMGFALADAVIDRGGKVTLVCGKVSVKKPERCETVDVESTSEMMDAVLRAQEECDVFIMSAAPADYRVKNRSDKKLKGDKIILELEKNPDISKRLGEIKRGRTMVVFAAETEDLINNAEKKLHNKNADLIVANDVTQEGAGFNHDTNIATLIYADGRMECLPLMTKRELADIILDSIVNLNL